MKIIYLTLLISLLSACQTTTVDNGNADNTANQQAKNHQSSKSMANQKTKGNKTLSPQQQSDLWQRITMQLNPEIDVSQQRFQDQLNWYKKHPSYMKHISRRAQPYLYYMVEEIEKRDLPLELALLPIVESAFIPDAYSSGHAAGLWQIIPMTGKRFGLAQNSWYDGRRDVHASTQAALDYLEYLNRFFDGNWEHAIAAYNSGEGRVQNAIRANARQELPIDFYSLNLPRETQAYVPKLLALSYILQNPSEFDIEVPAIANEVVFERVEIGGQISFSKVSELTGATQEQLSQLNPGHKKWATSPAGPHYLLVPYESAPKFTLALESLPQKDRMQYLYYSVVSGDNLGSIAQRHQSSVSELKSTNRLKSDRLKIGQELLIPQAPDFVVAAAKKSQANKKAISGVTHQVVSGDSLWSISRKHEVSTSQLMQWNGLTKNSVLKLGQKIVVKPTSVTASADKGQRNYEVVSGDSLSVIAEKFEVSISELLKWNNLNKNHYIKPGQTLKIRI
ncbi:LysM peptidoglycan-binding domain-containing protein [Alginatibacterium sediminis]|uniref:LysM peptidoglycan-binding domain-containing protein n=1 Tax=Alginatibacterium sediminis TaxID=2164068 RepID=A0A420E9D8_9ALTE|nr:LysM peptidoglycan-binding domain-containing protein [Alginatibacterium sediminis]RKF17378.1 LysM peptidoglycan-binding domain-containing protein [Alginatibacterium sediminis]